MGGPSTSSCASNFAQRQELAGSVYLLPLARGAAVYSMSMVIGELRIVANIARKVAAQKVFAHARASGNQAAAQAQPPPNVVRFAQEIKGQQYAMRLPRERILIIDTSSSIGGKPIRQARAALDLAHSQPQPGERFNVAKSSTLNSSASEAVTATPRPCIKPWRGSITCRPTAAPSWRRR